MPGSKKEREPLIPKTPNTDTNESLKRYMPKDEAKQLLKNLKDSRISLQRALMHEVTFFKEQHRTTELSETALKTIKKSLASLVEKLEKAGFSGADLKTLGANYNADKKRYKFSNITSPQQFVELLTKIKDSIQSTTPPDISATSSAPNKP